LYNAEENIWIQGRGSNSSVENIFTVKRFIICQADQIKGMTWSMRGRDGKCIQSENLNRKDYLGDLDGNGSKNSS
jgi:hypothetical protein